MARHNWHPDAGRRYPGQKAGQADSDQPKSGQKNEGKN
jgi:hypothetical protein